MTSPYAAEPPAGQPGNAYGNPYGGPYGNPYGGPYGSPHGGPYGSPYGQAPAAPAGRAPTALATATIVLAIVITLVEVARAVAVWPAADDYERQIRSGGSALDVLTPYDALAVLLLPALVAAWVVGCLWLTAARSNTALIDPRCPHRRGKVWVWLGWWVPIVSLWFPFQVVRDVQQASGRARRPVGLGLWWTAWLGYLLGSRAVGRLGDGRDLSEVEILPGLEVLTAVCAVVACAAWCRIVRNITAMQDAAFRPQ